MKFLIDCTDRLRATETRLPLRGSVVEVEGMDGLFEWQAKLGHMLILHAADHVPWWVGDFELFDDEDKADQHMVPTLPEDWQGLRWIEVYNGRRE